MKLRDFRHIDLFADLDEAELDLELKGQIVELRQGELFFHEGDEVRLFFVVLEGTIRVYRMIKGQKLPITDFPAGSTGGEVPLLSGTPHLANGMALTDVKLLALEEEDFWFLLTLEPVRKKILADMANRMRDLQLLSTQREKLVSLGTLAAGLAHELNNPAAAANRAAQNLVKTVEEFGSHSSGMLKWVTFKELQNDQDPFLPLIEKMQLIGLDLDTLTQGEREDELTDWLEQYEIAEPWNLAATLVSVGYTREILEQFAETLLPEHIPNVLIWLAKDIEMRLLANELVESTGRISALVQAMKSYSYVDQAVAKTRVDLHAGIDNTLIILSHKLKVKNIQVVKVYDKNLEPITAFGGELNQVWTNLLDNAIDALPKGGAITIKSYQDDNDPNMVSVEVIDNGPGIPEDIQDKIFDPFFTTKAVGEGTGLGLEVVYRIVVDQHHGTVHLFSEPGQTRFKVCLPKEL